MINLHNITLVCLNGVNPQLGLKALIYSSKQIKFGRSILFSTEKPDNMPEYIEHIKLDHMTHEKSSLFSIKEMNNYIDTEYCLSIHDDGFVINPHLWDNNFLNYDYIGAPWSKEAPWCPINRVGNGGFCLKSKKFLNLMQKLNWGGQHDDVMITNTYYDYFVNAGCRYAPVEVAMRFSLESKIDECEYNLDNCFGFHGKGDAWVFKGEGQQFKDKIKLLETI